MSIEWGLAAQIGGIGFGFVFAVLIILAVAIWIIGLVARKMEVGEEETGDSKKGG